MRKIGLVNLPDSCLLLVLDVKFLHIALDLHIVDSPVGTLHDYSKPPAQLIPSQALFSCMTKLSQRTLLQTKRLTVRSGSRSCKAKALRCSIILSINLRGLLHIAAIA